jgi:hypothetical protein
MSAYGVLINEVRRFKLKANFKNNSTAIKFKPSK